MPDAENTFAELRVLDLSGRVVGAYASKLFADYGADVIAVEPPGGGPRARRGAGGVRGGGERFGGGGRGGGERGHVRGATAHRYQHAGVQGRSAGAVPA